ncbi:hypothetical protein [Streptomyces sp. NPDC007369]
MRAFAVAAAVLITAGAFWESIWLLGVGTWAAIIAIVIQLVYRP